MTFARTAKAALLATAAATLATAAAAQTESVIHSFPNNSGLYSRLFEDLTGALYGSEYYGPVNKGSIYQLTERKGVWTERSISRFSGYDGKNPQEGLVQDSTGLLYGTTVNGGSYGLGTAFSLAPSGGKLWSETVILDFNGPNGEQPESDLTVGKTGAIFGTASSGGNENCGTVYELTKSGNGWTETPLYNFQGGRDGCGPLAGLHPGTTEETFCGSTLSGGSNNLGTVFAVREAHGRWTEKVLHSFAGGSDGAYPRDIDVDPSGNIYGVADEGGTYGDGLVFELTREGKWQEIVIHDFAGGSDGNYPVGMHFDKTNGALYGTTTYGGSENGGTVFQLTGSGNSWSETILHSFGTSTYDGLYSQARPIVDQTSGSLYGTTLDGGQYGGGTVWSITF